MLLPDVFNNCGRKCTVISFPKDKDWEVSFDQFEMEKMGWDWKRKRSWVIAGQSAECIWMFFEDNDQILWEFRTKEIVLTDLY